MLFWKGKLRKQADRDFVDVLCGKITEKELYKKLRAYALKIN